MSTQPFLVSLSSGGLRGIERSQVIQIAGELGFDALDLRCVEPHLSRTHARRDRTLIQLELQLSNLKLAALTLDTNFVEANQGGRSREEVLEYIELANAYGTPLLNITVTSPETDEETLDQWDVLEEFLGPCIEAAERRRVRLGVDTRVGASGDIPRLLERFNSPALGATVDLACAAMSKRNPEELIAGIAHRLFLVRVRDVKLPPESDDPEWVPLGEGMITYPPFLRALVATGYQGYLSLEAFVPTLDADPRDTIARDLAYLRRLIGCYAR